MPTWITGDQLRKVGCRASYGDTARTNAAHFRQMLSQHLKARRCELRAFVFIGPAIVTRAAPLRRIFGRARVPATPVTVGPDQAGADTSRAHAREERARNRQPAVPGTRRQWSGHCWSMCCITMSGELPVPDVNGNHPPAGKMSAGQSRGDAPPRTTRGQQTHVSWYLTNRPHCVGAGDRSRRPRLSAPQHWRML
jgi:hypothetical protein